MGQNCTPTYDQLAIATALMGLCWHLPIAQLAKVDELIGQYRTLTHAQLAEANTLAGQCSRHANSQLAAGKALMGHCTSVRAQLAEANALKDSTLHLPTLSYLK